MKKGKGSSIRQQGEGKSEKKEMSKKENERKKLLSMVLR